VRDDDLKLSFTLHFDEAAQPMRIHATCWFHGLEGKIVGQHFLALSPCRPWAKLRAPMLQRDLDRYVSPANGDLQVGIELVWNVPRVLPAVQPGMTVPGFGGHALGFVNPCLQLLFRVPALQTLALARRGSGGDWRAGRIGRFFPWVLAARFPVVVDEDVDAGGPTRTRTWIAFYATSQKARAARRWRASSAV